MDEDKNIDQKRQVSFSDEKIEIEEEILQDEVNII